MKAMILAAGRGKRMQPLSDHTPKPLLKVGQLRLIEYHLHRLRDIGIKEIIINTAWLAEQIHKTLGDGSQYGVSISYSDEHAGGLETAGGIINALSLLGDDPFLVINGDIYCDFDFSTLQLTSNDLAQLVFVKNPPQHTHGDFSSIELGIQNAEHSSYTFSGIGLYHPDLFKGCEPGKSPLKPIFDQLIQQQKLSAVIHNGQWWDIGTPIRLQQLHNLLQEETMQS